MEERWVDIKGYEGIYQISNFGNIKSLPKMIKTRWGGEFQKNECLRNVVKNGNNYSNVYLYNNKGRFCFSVHRLVATHFIPNPENKPEINHINGIKSDNRAINLAWCTPSENVKHSFESLRRKPNRGENVVGSKLTHVQVLDIIDLLSKGEFTHRQISEFYGVCRSTISQISKGKRWKHIKK